MLQASDEALPSPSRQAWNLPRPTLDAGLRVQGFMSSMPPSLPRVRAVRKHGGRPSRRRASRQPSPASAHRIAGSPAPGLEELGPGAVVPATM
ncbi:hypothetical protein G6O67_007951 [Ophiocordyceps sinensis]|uniref:Uncharacterized protein n=1 Tax=Ophiocordyceps sinensis TaxID=72228 RepID=A0A8H4PN60_9HYPO|nr:hypothetical protein G6O67_007951 [Ophiocordyceps sinensis]